MAPDYQVKIYNEQEGEDFLVELYGENSDEVRTFRNLIPKAYKSDIWRYAVLYKKGGVWVDIDSVGYVPFDEIIGDNPVVLVREAYESGLINGFFATVPEHPLFKLCKDMTIHNTKNKLVPPPPTDSPGSDFLTVSGPILMGRAANIHFGRAEDAKFDEDEYRRRKMKMYYFNRANTIHMEPGGKGKIILGTRYEGYIEETRQNRTYHKDYFEERKIYGETF